MTAESENRNHSAESQHSAEKVQAVIEKEVEMDIAPVLESGDEETAEFLRGVMHDLRESSYTFLSWVKTQRNPGKVLYPASGSDRIPKLAFGENHVVHTSLETAGNDRQNYYNQLGAGMKVIADNTALPFQSGAFDTVCLMDSQKEVTGDDPDELLRVLKPGGMLLVCKNNTLNPEDTRIDELMQNDNVSGEPVPDDFQMQGDAQAEFAVFRKK